MEKFWLAMAIASFLFAIYKAGEMQSADVAIYFLFPLIAAALFYARYYVRKKIENSSKDE